MNCTDHVGTGCGHLVDLLPKPQSWAHIEAFHPHLRTLHAIFWIRERLQQRFPIKYNQRSEKVVPHHVQVHLVIFRAFWVAPDCVQVRLFI